MKFALLSAAALFATPLIAQTTPPTTPTNSPTTADPAQNGMPSTTPTAPGQMNTGAAPLGSDGSMPAAPAGQMQNGQMQSGQAQNGQMQGNSMPMADNGQAMAASGGKLPYCRAGQYTGCREHSNAAGARVHKRRR